MNKPMTIVLATGGSGGHIFPALQTALELKKLGHEVIFVGVLGIAQDKIQDQGFVCHNIDAQGFNDRSPLGITRFTLSMVCSFIQAVRILKQVAPYKVVGFGGYSSFPVIVAARLCNCLIMIHEQNVLPGKANRILAKLVDKIAISFKNSSKYFNESKTVWTGCPCHDTLANATRENICLRLGLDPNKRTIVLLGGSQGSLHLNQVFFEAIPTFDSKGWQAIHMTGKKDYDRYVQKYQHLNLPVVVTSFISPIEEIYTIIDVMIGRCGAATVSELGAFHIPSVLIPYPYAGNHQKYNGQVLSEVNAAILIEQDDLTLPALEDAVTQCMSAEFSRTCIKERTKDLFQTNAARRLAKAVEQC